MRRPVYEEEREYYRLLDEREKRMCRRKRMGVEVTSWSSEAYNNYMKQVEKRLAKKRRKYKVPKFVALDLRQYPLLVKLDFAALFLGVVALTLPFWCRVYDENDEYLATFGLWSYCESDADLCMSVHDNIIPGKDVPAWYSMCQWNFFIGLALNFMTLAILTSNVRNEEVRMSGTIYMASECFSAMAGLEKFVSVYIFSSFIDNADFLYTWGSTVEYHAAFYCGAVSVALDVITAVVLFLQEEIGPPPSRQQVMKKTEPQLFYENDMTGVYHHEHDDDVAAFANGMSPETVQSDRVIVNDIKGQASQFQHKVKRTYVSTVTSSSHDCADSESSSINGVNSRHSLCGSRDTSSASQLSGSVDVDESVQHYAHYDHDIQFSTIVETEEEQLFEDDL